MVQFWPPPTCFSAGVAFKNNGGILGRRRAFERLRGSCSSNCGSLKERAYRREAVASETQNRWRFRWTSNAFNLDPNCTCLPYIYISVIIREKIDLKDRNKYRNFDRSIVCYKGNWSDCIGWSEMEIEMALWTVSISFYLTRIKSENSRECIIY